MLFKFRLMAEHGDDGGAGGGTGTATVDPPEQGGDGGKKTQSGTLLDDKAVDSLLSAVQQKLDEGLKPVTEKQAQLTGRVDELGKISQAHQEQRDRLFGGAPFARKGEDVMNSRGYQYYRIVGHAQGAQGFSADNCKHEMEISRQLDEFYSRQGLQKAGVRTGISEPVMVPLGSGMIADEIRQSLDEEFGDFQQFLGSGMAGATPDGIRHQAAKADIQQNLIQQALSMFDDSALGIFTDAGPMGEMITLIRNQELLTRVGATQVTLPPNGHLDFGKQTGSATGYWVGEEEAITGSEQTTGRLELRAKKCAALVTIPNELIRFGTSDVEAFIRADIARVLALLIDLAGLQGTGGTQPKGILNHSGIINHTSSLTLATDGNTFNPDTPASMIADLEEVNHDPERDGLNWCMRGKMWKNIRTRRTGSGYAADDGAGGWLFDVNRADISNGQATRLDGHPVVKSSQVSNTREKGSSSDLSYVLGGIFRHLFIARVGVLEFATATQGDTTFAQDQSKLRAIQHADIGLRYEDAFVIADKLDMDLPA